MIRRILIGVGLVAGFFIVGGLFSIGARMWIGGLNEQSAQLHQCVLTSQHAHPNEDARSMLAHLDVEVPECMEGAGYEKALDNNNCSPTVWQGDVYCYLPKSFLARLLYKIETF